MQAQSPHTDNLNYTAVIIAGGQGSRLGGQDKGLLTLQGKPFISHIIEQLELQPDNILINANRNLEIYRQMGVTVISDSLPDFPGPLAGILTALESVSTDYIITLPCDSPTPPTKYLSLMQHTLKQSDAEIAIAHDGERIQQMYAMIPVSLKDDLRHFLLNKGRAIKHWLATHKLVTVDFSGQPAAFHNINTHTDLDALNR